MKKALAMVLALAFAFALVGCSGSSDSQESAYEVDYGTSSLYTQEDMDAAIGAIMTEFNSWEGCTMKRIYFTDDAACEEALTYLNDLAKDGVSDYDAAIVFKSVFHSPSEELAEGTAWEPDTDYTDYEWYLARKGGGDWQLLTMGY